MNTDPGLPSRNPTRSQTATRRSPLRCLVRAALTILGHRLDHRICQWPNQTGDDQ